MAAAKRGRGIIAVLSPAKTLDLRPLAEREFGCTDVDPSVISQLSATHDAGRCDAGKTNLVANTMKAMKEKELKELLGISDSLAKTAHEHWQDYQLDAAGVAFRPAIYTFSGPAYKGLDPATCNAPTLSYLASNLFVLDPVYGALGACSGVQPYRLEMGTKLLEAADKKGKKEALSSFWREAVTRHLGMQLTRNGAKKGGILANLASEEYSSAIDPASLPKDTTFLNVVFRHQGRVIAVHAKRARGLMARYLAETEASTLEEIAQFNVEGYACVASDDGQTHEQLDTVGEGVKIVRLIFDRVEAPAKKVAGKRAGTAKGGGSAGTKRRK
ncbi:hypothetical protein ACHAXT_001901 [Thalassiosira profunda]